MDASASLSVIGQIPSNELNLIIGLFICFALGFFAGQQR